MMSECQICKTKITEKNDGMFLRQFLTEKEIDRIPISHLCIDCKKEMIFAGIIAVI